MSTYRLELFGLTCEGIVSLVSSVQSEGEISEIT